MCWKRRTRGTKTLVPARPRFRAAMLRCRLRPDTDRQVHAAQVAAELHRGLAHEGAPSRVPVPGGFRGGAPEPRDAAAGHRLRCRWHHVRAAACAPFRLIFRAILLNARVLPAAGAADIRLSEGLRDC